MCIAVATCIIVDVLLGSRCWRMPRLTYTGNTSHIVHAYVYIHAPLPPAARVPSTRVSHGVPPDEPPTHPTLSHSLPCPQPLVHPSFTRPIFAVAFCHCSGSLRLISLLAFALPSLSMRPDPVLCCHPPVRRVAPHSGASPNNT